MFRPITYEDLCAAMRTGATVAIDRTTGTIRKISREDGSGRSWLVELSPEGGGEPVTKHVRTP